MVLLHQALGCEQCENADKVHKSAVKNTKGRRCLGNLCLNMVPHSPFLLMGPLPYKMACEVPHSPFMYPNLPGEVRVQAHTFGCGVSAARVGRQWIAAIGRACLLADC